MPINYHSEFIIDIFHRNNSNLDKNALKEPFSPMELKQSYDQERHYFQVLKGTKNKE